MADEPACAAPLASGSSRMRPSRSPARPIDVGLQLLGPSHPDVLAYEMNLANVYRAKGRYTGGRAAVRAQSGGTAARARRRASRDRRHDGKLRQFPPGDRPLREGRIPSSPGARHQAACAGREGAIDRVEDEQPGQRPRPPWPLRRSGALMQRTLELKIELYGAGSPDHAQQRRQSGGDRRTTWDIRERGAAAPAGARRPHARPRCGPRAHHLLQGTSGQHSVELGPLRGSGAPRGDCRSPSDGEPRRTAIDTRCGGTRHPRSRR